MTIGLSEFDSPATDGSVSLNQLVDYHLGRNPECGFAMLVDVSESSNEQRVVKYRQLAHATHRAAHTVNPGSALPQGTRVAILTSTDTIVNIALVLGILRAGLVPFPISPRVSVAGICHLLIATETVHMVSGGGSAIAHLVENVLSMMEESQQHLNIIYLPTFKELFQPRSGDLFEPFPDPTPLSENSVVAILHSSGSTGLPRPVTYTQGCILSSFVNQPPCYGMGRFGARVGLMALPTFHVMGFITHCFYPQFAGFTSVLFAPGATPVVPSPDVTLRAVVRSQCTFLLTVPTFLEAWSHDNKAINHLKKIDGVVYAGGPLIPHVGNRLVERGVSLRAAYGATEFGAPVEFDLVKRAPEDWIYIEFPDNIQPELIPQNDQDGTYELVMLSTPIYKPFVVNYKNERGGVGYATKDLVVPHPTKLGLWKVVGRLDDQIVLLNGEKTNPVPIEDQIVKSPLIQSAIMFGREQNQTGVLIELHNQVDSLANVDYEKIINQIWPFVELANSNTSTHSRIAREAIIFSETSRPLPRTPKGNVARAAALKLYANDITRMYAQLGQGSSLTSLGAPASWDDVEGVQFWLTRCVTHLLGRQLDPYDDLFQQGFDSLTATLLSGVLRRALSLPPSIEPHIVAEKVTQQSIFNHPSILQLATYLVQLTNNSTSCSPSAPETSTMQTMIARYTQNMKVRHNDPDWPLTGSEPIESVVITGTTGSLGSHILAQLLTNERVKRVWAINRPRRDSGVPVIERQRISFEDKALPIVLLSHPKLTFLECNLNENQLGLSNEDYELIQSSATTIIHNAWQVDFNWNLQSFEPNVQGTRYLVDLALNSTWKRAPRLVFTSSISVAGLGLPGRSLGEEYLTSSSISLGFGYGESKYVAERVLEAAKMAGLETCVIRLGQLSGDRISGSWSKTDWFPSMLASSLTIGYLPDAIGVVSWVPLDAAAQSLLDSCCQVVAELPTVVHIAHPQPSAWPELMKIVTQVIAMEFGKELPFIPLDEWNKMVSKASGLYDDNDTRKRLPTVKLQASVDVTGFGKVETNTNVFISPATSPKKMDDAWGKTSEQVLTHFSVNYHTGLTTGQVLENTKRYGKNELPEEPATPLWELILEQFKDQLVLILLGSAVISFVLALFEDHGDSGLFMAFVEPAVILLILVANAAVGVIQETKAERAIDALKEYSPDEAKVTRDGHVAKIHASDLVPGDIVSIAVGDRIPADCRIIEIHSSSFRIDQAILTGESQSVGKIVDAISDTNVVKQDMTNMVFSGTTVVNGNATAIVVRTGEQTAIGDIHRSISSQISEKTPLKRKLDDFGDMLAKVITVICILVWIVNVRHFWDPAHHGVLQGAVYYFKIAVALAVAAIPEGLAAVITACLALGTKKMAQKNAIVRNLPSVETLGATNVICSDKTGTLTTNQMSVSRVLVIDSVSGDPVEYSVEGTTFAPTGSISSLKGNILSSRELQTESMIRLAEVSALCNDAKIVYNEEKDTYTNVGEPTEAALRVLVEKIGCPSAEVTKSFGSLTPRSRSTAVNDYYESQYKRLLTFEFSRDRKMMSVLVKHASNPGSGATLFVKGAPESVLERCNYICVGGQLRPLSQSLRSELLGKVSEVGSQGLRTLALAYSDKADGDASHYKLSTTAEYSQFEQGLVFVGLVGMLDPPRPEVRSAIANCRAAGIRVICITGDNKKTAEAICRQIGIFGLDEDLNGKSYTGRELDALSHEDKILAVQRASLFSRTEPGHKSQLVDLLQGLGLVVAMTGDGVNDAPALKKADIGVAMGSGTDVAKLAADMVLADSNFATIETAVEEGRLIYNNTKQFIRYLISSNIGEVVSIFLTVLLGMPEALIPVQLLWVNLVTDSLPATALGFNPPDHTIMRMPPRDVREPLVGKWLFIRYLIIGTYVGFATVFGYAWWFIFYEGGPQITFHQLTHFHQCSSLFPEIGCAMFTNEMAKTATTISLSILVTVEMFNAANSLSENESLLVLPVWKNPYLVAAIALSMTLHFAILYIPFFTALFSITPLNWQEWKAVVLISLPVIAIDEILKYISATFVDPPSKLKLD
ncbi:Sarcoplasmic/endoplasmic reticulum calcium ATPase 3 [Rhizoctonia solani]|uniref:Calcium-transporting ATPase n=1 Tax=Rhizoctonia solani TaxID=456999 RepID=A0A8H7LJG6_9AGAM|nr:Sarcoplasmic/endoplasmic reticulum calcium ATPase 3 [Rhizoctonia solani]